MVQAEEERGEVAREARTGRPRPVLRAPVVFLAVVAGVARAHPGRPVPRPLSAASSRARRGPCPDLSCPASRPPPPRARPPAPPRPGPAAGRGREEGRGDGGGAREEEGEEEGRGRAGEGGGRGPGGPPAAGRGGACFGALRRGPRRHPALSPPGPPPPLSSHPPPRPRASAGRGRRRGAFTPTWAQLRIRPPLHCPDGSPRPAAPRPAVPSFRRPSPGSGPGLGRGVRRGEGAPRPVAPSRPGLGGPRRRASAQGHGPARD